VKKTVKKIVKKMMNRTAKISLVMSAGLCTALVGAAFARQDSPDKMKGSGMLSHMDRTFMTKAEQSNLAEIAAGNLAWKQSNNETVKTHAQHMITDHADASTKLNMIAKNKSVALPKDPDPKNQQVYKQLSMLMGSAFDAKYIKSQRAGHVAAVALFRNEVKNGKDPDVHAFAVKTLPTIEAHLKMFQSMSTKPMGAMGHGGSKMQSGMNKM